MAKIVDVSSTPVSIGPGLNMHSHDRTLITSLGFSDPDKKDNRHDLACQYLSEASNALKVCQIVGMEKQTESTSAAKTGVGIAKTVVTNKIKSINTELETPIRNRYSVIGFSDVLIHANIITSYSTTIDIEPISYIELATEKLQGRLPNEYKANKARIRETSKLITECKNKECDLNYTYRIPQNLCIDCKTGDNYRLLTEKLPIRETIVSSYEANHDVAVEVKANKVSVNDVLRQIKFYNEFTTYWSWVLVTLYPINGNEKDILEKADIKHITLGANFENWCSTRQQYTAPEI